MDLLNDLLANMKITDTICYIVDIHTIHFNLTQTDGINCIELDPNIVNIIRLTDNINVKIKPIRKVYCYITKNNIKQETYKLNLFLTEDNTSELVKKIELLTKLEKFKTDGVKLSTSFDFYSKIDDMQYEIDYINAENQRNKRRRKFT